MKVLHIPVVQTSKPGLKMIVHHIPGIPIQRHIIKYHELITMTSTHNRISVEQKDIMHGKSNK